MKSEDKALKTILACLTFLGLNKAGFILHSTIHQCRPDLNCIIHVHSPNVVAVSIQYLIFYNILSSIFEIVIDSFFMYV